MTRLILLLIFLFVIPLMGFAQESNQRRGSITGCVVDAQTLEPLIGVNLIIEKTLNGAATDTDGRFEITNLTPGIYTVTVRYIGYETQLIPDIVVGVQGADELYIKLNPATLQGDEITVTTGYFSETNTEGIGKVSFTPEEIRRNPGAGQELSRVLAALPSVASRGETSTDLLVRGGSPTENGNYIDNIPVPNVRHFTMQGGRSNGPIGIVNTDLVSDIEFSAGGFTSKFGNHLSSVSDISYRDGNSDHIRGNLGFNMAGGGGDINGPLGKKTTFLLSARRSYLDLLADAINSGGAPRYNDAQAKLSFNPSKKDKIILLSIYGASEYESTFEDAREEGFPDAVYNGNDQNTIGTNWRHLWGNGYTNTSLSYSYKNIDQHLRDAITEQTSIKYDAREAQEVLRSITYLRLNPTNSVEFGGEFTLEQNEYDYFYAGGTNVAGEVRPDYIRNDNVDGGLAAGFFSYNLQITPKLSATAGLRGTYNSYNEDFNMAPRVKARYQLTPKMGLSAAYGVHYQAVPRYLISQNEALADLKSTRADHYILSADYLLSDDTKLTIDLYNKEYSNAPILPLVNNVGIRSYILDSFQSFYENLNDNGEAYARGVEVLVQKKLAVNFYGMVSASYFRTRYKDYLGEWQDREYDNRMLFSVIGGYRPNDLWEVSVRWSYLGGRTYTPIDAQASEAAGSEIYDMSAFNSERYPAYHSLFTRIDRRYFLKRTNLVTFVEIWNTYNRANVDADYWNIHTNQIDQATQFSFLPVGGVMFEF